MIQMDISRQVIIVMCLVNPTVDGDFASENVDIDAFCPSKSQQQKMMSR